MSFWNLFVGTVGLILTGVWGGGGGVDSPVHNRVAQHPLEQLVGGREGKVLAIGLGFDRI